MTEKIDATVLIDETPYADNNKPVHMWITVCIGDYHILVNVNREEVEKAIKDNKKKINERANAWQEAKDDLRGFKEHDYHDDIFLQNFYPDC